MIVDLLSQSLVSPLVFPVQIFNLKFIKSKQANTDRQFHYDRQMATNTTVVNNKYNVQCDGSLLKR